MQPTVTISYDEYNKMKTNIDSLEKAINQRMQVALHAGMYEDHIFYLTDESEIIAKFKKRNQELEERIGERQTFRP